MKYILMDRTKTDWFPSEFDTAQEAIEQGRHDWDRMSDHDKSRRTEFFVLESVNPDEDADDHYDGNPIKTWK